MTEPSTETTPQKATLICPECDHTSPPDGDWQLRRRLRTTVYRCPCCGTEVVTRPADRRLPIGRIAALPVALTALWTATVRDLGRLLNR